MNMKSSQELPTLESESVMGTLGGAARRDIRASPGPSPILERRTGKTSDP